MRHLNKIVRSLMTPPRESRLRKAALTLLVAATAAFFVCAQASAAAPALTDIPDIQIVSSSHSGSYSSPVHVFEDAETEFTIATNTNFDRVEWKLGHQWSYSYQQEERDPGPGTTSDFTPDLDGMGAPYGIRRYIEVTAYDANGASDFQRIWLIVWRETNLPNMIGNMTGPHYDSQNESYNVVVGESFTADAWTTVLFDRVEWFIMTPAVWVLETPENKFVNPVHVTDGPDRTATFPHTFSQGEGGEGNTLESGRKYHIVARAFSLRDPTNQDDAAVYEIPIHVHEGKTKSILEIETYAGGIEPAVYMNIYSMSIFRVDADDDGVEDEWGCSVSWDHSIGYYNEVPNSTAYLYAWVKLYEVNTQGIDWELSTEFSADDPENPPEGIAAPRLVWHLNIAYKDSNSQCFDRTMRGAGLAKDGTRLPAQIVEEKEYYLLGETRVEPSLDDKPHDERGWVYRGPSIMYTTETRQFKPNGASGEFWVEGWNPTPPESEEEE